MRILGVDPGTWRTGAGVIETDGNRCRLLHFEVITLPKKTEISARLKLIFQGLTEVIRIYEPTVLALENIFHGRDVRAMIRIGEARACAMLAASERGIEVVEYLPTRIKQAVSGNGRAAKEQVQQMVKRLLCMKELPPSDGADALAVALCHWHSRSSLSQRLAGIRSAKKTGVPAELLRRALS